MCNSKKTIPAPREIAKDFLKYHYGNDKGYVLSPIEWYNNAYQGCSCYSAMIGFYASNGKHYGQDKIVVEIGNQMFVFS